MAGMWASWRSSTWIKMLPTVAMLIAGWLCFAPTEVSGPAAYVIVSGISMEPGMHRGDLVILHRAQDYQVGDVVTYWDPQIGRVIHRIVTRDGERFIFKGDHNTWLDPYRPTQAELIGKLWVYMPGAGKWLEQLRTPLGLTVLATLLGVTVVTSGGKRRPRRYGSSAGRRTSKGGQMSATNTGAHAGDWLFILAALVVGAATLGALAFTRPLTVPGSEDLAYRHTGAFTYTADAPPGVYDGDTVRTGQPIFRRLIERVNIGYTYRLASDYPAGVAGTQRLAAELSNSNGWSTTLPLQPPVAFAGPAASVGAVLDLSQVQALIDGVEGQTGVASSSYTLAIVPTVVVSGTLAGQPLQDEFAPRLVFQLDRLQMKLAAGGAEDAAGAKDALQPEKPGTLKRPRDVQNTLPLLGFKLPVGIVRIAAVAGLLAGLAGLIVLGVLARRGGPQDEAGAIAARYGPLLLNVHELNPAPQGRIVDVAGIDNLEKIARRFEALILHSASDGAHTYAVLDHDVTYRYRAGRGVDAAAPIVEEDGP
jgi:signal peptidase I